MRRACSIATLLFVLGSMAPTHAYTLQYRDQAGSVPIRWSHNSITVAFSSSLQSPPTNIKSGSDVIGAARRALQHWATAGNIKFVETSSAAQAISPANRGDGLSLITVAAENAALFGTSEAPGRTRVFFAPNGAIAEADIAINPTQLFSTDGTVGTYDLEATLTHEIGHLLGLEHSAVLGATMQPRQAKNGVYGLPALTGRTLAEDDRAGVRALYDSRQGNGSIKGKLIAGELPGELSTLVFGAHVFAESITTGKVVAGNISLSTGEYRVDGLAPGTYRIVLQSLGGLISASDIAGAGGSYSGLIATKPLFRTVEASDLSAKDVKISSSAINAVDVKLDSDLAPALVPQVAGLNGELSTTPLPLEAGKTYTVYVGGSGVDQVGGNGITASSPFVKVDPASLTAQSFSAGYPVVSFNVSVAANAPFGDYSLRLQSSSGEVAYLAGALTIDPGVTASGSANAADDAQFFVRQHYADFLGREPDADGLAYWTNEIRQCGTDAACIAQRRIGVSAAFFVETEFQEASSFVYRLYKSALGRRPTFAEFTADRAQVVSGQNLDANKEAFARGFVARREFQTKYPGEMTGQQFSDALLDTIREGANVDLSFERNALIPMYDGNNNGRATILRRLADAPAFARAEYNRAFVLMQYFGYLRRDPDQGGYQFWLNVLDNKLANDTSGYRSMVCAFVTSAEYQTRFGMVVTRNNSECAR
ncbi:MAG: hypothetical protein QOD75_3726 [Blastocatellia bacterium]|nr:hypothetical protein [Blastocatellia bacterium]